MKSFEKIESERSTLKILYIIAIIFLIIGLFYKNYKNEQNYNSVINEMSRCVIEDGKITGVYIIDKKYRLVCETLPKPESNADEGYT